MDMFDWSLDTNSMQRSVFARLQANGFPWQYNVGAVLCECWWVDEHYEEDEVGVQATNILLPIGGSDPWSELACYDSYPAQHQLAVVTPGVGHMADWMPFDVDEPAELTQTRNTIKAEIKYYLQSAGREGNSARDKSASIFTALLLSLLVVVRVGCGW